MRGNNRGLQWHFEVEIPEYYCSCTQIASPGPTFSHFAAFLVGQGAQRRSRLLNCQAELIWISHYVADVEVESKASDVNAHTQTRSRSAVLAANDNACAHPTAFRQS
jgi:hypothetical protein